MSDHGYREKIERLYFDGLVAGDLTAADDTVHADYTFHGTAGVEPGPEGMRAHIQTAIAVVSDRVVVIDDFIVEGDKAVVRYTVRGTHTGEWAGSPATGNPVDYTGIAIYRWAEGKIVEEWDCFEEMKMLTAFGLLPEANAPKQD